MAFNRKEFLAGFLNQVSGGMQKMREDAEEYKTQQEEAFGRNQSLIATRNSRANAAVALGKEALQYIPEGAKSKAMVRTAIASGMTGVKEFRDKLAAAHAEAGLGAGEKLSINDIEAVISMPNIPSIDQSLIDMSLEDFAKESYGAIGKATEVEDDTGVVGRLFGFGAKDRVKQELRETSGMGGMSIADVNAAARMNEFNALIPNAVMSFSEMERFGKTDSFTFARELAEEYQDLYSSDGADATAALALNGYLAQVEEEGGERSDVTDITIDNIRKEARKGYAQKELNRFIEGYANQYGTPAGGFFQQQFAMDEIEELMGAEYLEDLKKGYQVGNDDDADPKPQPKPESVAPVRSVRPIARPELGPKPVDPASVPSLSEGKERPTGERGGDIVKQRKWDKQYGKRYNPDRTPIIIEPRPTDPDATTTRTKPMGREYQVNAMAEWDRKYKETHNPDGTPKQFEDD
tara:strand:- start:4201 stop:5592 length:1392 start_codon:yes stop_codon:yes gene_type:complete